MTHPFLDQSFEIKWPLLKPENIGPDIEAAMEQAEAALAEIRAVSDKDAGYDSVIAALESAGETLSRPWQKAGHLEGVCDTPEYRDAYNAVLPKVSEFFSRIPLDEALWKAVRAASAKPETALLDPVRRRHVSETVLDFVEAGADLPKEKRERLAAIQSELSSFTQKYSENVLDSTNAYELVIDDPKKLAGLPPHEREAARQSALKKGYGTEAEPKWRFTLQFPSWSPAMEYLDDESVRKELYLAQKRVGMAAPWDNSALIWKILELRNEEALLLGKTNFADVATSRRMAKTGRAALDFVENMHDRVKPSFDRECRALEEFRAEKLGCSPERLEPWETGYWTEKLRKSRYDFDDEQLRPYFGIDNVIGGMFGIVERLYGVRLVERTGDKKPDVWHDDVRFYDVFEKESGAHIGSFYADWYPRASKRSGAWMDALVTGGALPSGGHAPHLGLVCGNLTEPQNGKPAFLTHREVETIFHEFGHLMHHVLGDVTVKSLSGTNVAWDFVEMPSQIMENWTWERASLDLFARHYETGETIPQVLFDKMVAARKFNNATFSMRQLSFGKMDLELHLNYEKYRGLDLDEAVAEIQRGYLMPLKSVFPSNIRSFGHLFSSPMGYAAGYYSYKWAEVLDADMFTRFLKEGILNERVGHEFREKVLSRGNSKPAGELFRDFMGRDPDPDALLLREGIIRK
jgi:oligopeptidase A